MAGSHLASITKRIFLEIEQEKRMFFAEKLNLKCAR
jgi:hypothetical protein